MPQGDEEAANRSNANDHVTQTTIEDASVVNEATKEEGGGGGSKGGRMKRQRRMMMRGLLEQAKGLKDATVADEATKEEEEQERAIKEEDEEPTKKDDERIAGTNRVLEAILSSSSVTSLTFSFVVPSSSFPFAALFTAVVYSSSSSPPILSPNPTICLEMNLVPSYTSKD
ncbi:hypothetical protein M0R45_029592 [Rubus argutus]|uniref:Uncharacterized protein n=1 Tax=Rubus argutus TaxID=59490 RepID=A0AAW1WCT3_RUBAR